MESGKDLLSANEAAKMPHPCYICGERVNNPLRDLCSNHETIMQSLEEKQRMRNERLSDSFSSGLEKEILNSISGTM